MSKVFLLMIVLWIVNNKSIANSFEVNEFVSNPTDSTDVTFQHFLTRFSNDSTFQISRIKFPLEIEYSSDDEEGTMLLREINKTDWFIINFFENEEYGSVIEIGNEVDNRANIQITGTDNGVVIDYYFEKIGKMWYLIKIVDQSN